MSKRIAEGLAATVAVVVLAAYALLLPSGRWQGDDYFNAWLIDQRKWSLLLRSLQWAPRPIGQPLGWFYTYVSDTFHRPFAAVFLGLLWFGCLAWIVVVGCVGRQRHPFALALILFALTLMVSKPGEMFYWPIGSAAYLPCWAGLAGVTILLRCSHVHGALLTASLLFASLSLEVGAVTVLIYVTLASAASLRSRQWNHLWPLIIPAICAAGVCLAVRAGRIQPGREIMDAASGLAGDWRASFVASIPTFTSEVLRITGLPLVAGAAIKLLLVAFLPASTTGPGERHSKAAIWACALVIAAFASEVSAYHQFGTQCCERHATQRQTMVVLAMLSMAGLLPEHAGPLRWLRPFGLSAVLIGLLCLRAGKLTADWQNQPLVLAARQRSWDSGRSQSEAMTLAMAPPGQITNFDSLPTGYFRKCGSSSRCDVPWYAMGIMGVFHKNELTISQGP